MIADAISILIIIEFENKNLASKKYSSKLLEPQYFLETDHIEKPKIA